MYKKIAIIGNAGSGKTTLAKKLSSLLDLPLYHMDQYFFHPNWQERDREEFKRKHDEICATATWIIDGCIMFTVSERLEHADMIIYLKISRWRCVFNVIQRALVNYGRVRESSPADCPEKFDRKFLKFVRYVWNFNTRYNEFIERDLSKYILNKPVYVLSSYKQIDEFIEIIQKSKN